MHRTRNRIATVVIHVELVVVAVIVLYPLAWIVGSSLGSGRSLAQASAIPTDPTLANYVRLFTDTPFATWYVNSFIVAVSNMVLSVLLSAIAAYVFARLRFAGRRLGLLVMLVIQIFPTFMTAIAIYILYLNFGLLDSLAGLVIASVAAAVPYNIWLLKGYLDGISTSLDEAAVLDGASHLQIFTRILLPLMTPMLTFVAVTQFAVPWMDFILPRLLISSPRNYTVAIGLFQLISDQTRNDFTTFAAGAILVAVPITVLYMVLQRYLVAGLAQGGEKE
ncbi:MULTISPECIES: sugar ABC transporter permease [Microbacterium]|jgi:arabinogalactan oligomer/maltooligosaccharide transport system permease protein|uniref:sugar ABC transporter permease n=1 Tax=Microbacterium TaxID=33882 RepID=UPI000E768F08|nr:MULTISPECIES: sugar ABC transporter permease [Microbacterium]RKE63595.1 carbohydrate ABC transporter membrane protein 2 (CUT1 family) [Microbacterium sp. AG238]WJM16776.1 sugar ABC transporter permease [Microbacterium arborescens]